MKRFLKVVGTVLGAIVFLFLGLIVVAAIFGGDGSNGRRAESMTAEEKVAKIAELEKEVEGLAKTNYRRKITLYKQLSSLDPTNKAYPQKAEFFAKKQDEARRMEDDPEQFVKITSFSWWTEGFGSVMMASFTIENRLPVDIKDIRIKCTHTAASGTVIDRNHETIYEIIESGEARSFREVNMGFIHAQAKQSSCEVLKVTPIEPG